MPEPTRGWRGRWRVVLLWTSPLLLLALGELAMRAVHTHDPASLPAIMASGADPAATTEDGRPVFRKVDQLMEPHADGVFRGHDHRTDEIGFRGPDRSARAAPGTRRVIVAGDSITMGSGVDEQEAYPAVAEAWLNERASPPRWEIVNGGIAGANIAGALARLQKGLAHYGADLLVYAFSVNDIEGRHYQRFPAERTAIDLIREAGWPARSSSALIRVATWEWLDLWDRIQQLNLDHYTHEVRYNYFENPPARAAFRMGLDRLARLGETRGLCVVVLMQTRLVALDPEAHPFVDIYDEVGAEARARGLHVVETRPSFFGLDPDDVRRSMLDPHPDEAGHALLAAALGEGIARLPASCWSRPGAR